MNIEEIDRWCDLFEERLKAGDEISIESFLEEHQLAPDNQLFAELRRVHQECSPNGASDVASTQEFSAATTRTTIGNYKLMQPIGEGGMGTVYMAEQQEPVRRRVALKIIKPGMDSQQVIARFEAERQALAMMDHQNIARVLDAGTTDAGHPFFVMELVKGIPITKYCDDNKLTISERLQLFIPLCQAIQHAHQKGIIHRDIKPSNVLVCNYDGQPVPKVIDFGVAKAVEQRLTDKTMFTQFGQVIGTLEYMSPEQAGLSQLDIDTRSDIYSLGVLLYELLTGSTPLTKQQLRKGGFEEMMRLIREEEPQKPSTRLSGSGDALPSISAQRRTEPRKLGGLLRGDLDWIAMKALEKDRTRRYETAVSLAHDVQRYLDDDAVEARPPSVTYRLRKVLRKHKAAFGTAATLLLVLLIATTISALFAMRNAKLAAEMKELAQKKEQLANNMEEAAITERDLRLETEQRSYNAILAASAADLQRNRSTTIRGRLQQAPKRLRGWEWDYLWNESDRSLGSAIVLPFEARGYRMQLSPDGSLLAARPVRYPDRQATKLYDIRTGKEVATLEDEKLDSRGAMTISSDSRLICCHSGNYRARFQIFEVQTGRPLVPADQQDTYESFLCFDAQGKRVVILDGGTIRVFEVKDWKEIAELPGRFSRHRTGAISPDGRLLVVGSRFDHDCIRVFDLQAKKLLREVGEDQVVHNVHFDAVGDSVSIVSDDGIITRYAVGDWTKVKEVGRLRKQGVGLARYLLDGSQGILSVDENGAVVVFDQQLRKTATLRGHGASADSIAFNADRSRVITAHSDGAVLRWDLNSPQSLAVRSESIAFAKDSATAYVGLSADANEPNQVCEVDVVTGNVLGYLRWYPVTHRHGSYATGLALSPHGDRLAVATKSGWGQGRWRVYDRWTGLADHEELCSTRGDRPWWGDLHCIDWSADGRLIAVGGDLRRTDRTPTGRVRIYDGKTYVQLGQMDDHTGPVNSLVFSRDGEVLVTASDDGTLRSWRTSNREVLHTLRGAAFKCLVFSPDDRYVVAGSANGNVVGWNPRTGEEVFQAKGHAAVVTSVSFMPDGSRLATASGDRSLKLWEPTAWRELMTLEFDEAVKAMSFSPDGERLALAGNSFVVLDAESEGYRWKERMQERGRRDRVRPLVHKVLDGTDTVLDARDRVAADATLDAPTRRSALIELRLALDQELFDAYTREGLEDYVSPVLERYVLGNQLVASNSWISISGLVEVVNSLPDLSDLRRQALVEYASAHQLGSDARTLAWNIAIDPERSLSDYALGIFGIQGVVEKGDSLNTMAALYYRANLFQDALKTAQDSNRLIESGALPHNVAVIAMSLHRMGQVREAEEAMQQLETLMKQQKWADDSAAASLHREARSTLTGRSEEAWNDRAAWDAIRSALEELELDPAKFGRWLSGAARASDQLN